MFVCANVSLLWYQPAAELHQYNRAEVLHPLFNHLYTSEAPLIQVQPDSHDCSLTCSGILFA